MGLFRFTLRTPDGDDAGEVELGHTPQAGDEIILSGNRRAIVTAVIPLPKIEEFVSRPTYGALEIEPVGSFR